MVPIIVLMTLYFEGAVEASCTPSITKVSAGDWPLGQLCSGQLVLNEEFDRLDTDLWQHEITFGGGGVSINKNYINLHPIS